MVDLDHPVEMTLQFLEQADSDIRTKYNDFKQDRLVPNQDISMTTLDSMDKDQLFPFLLRTELGVNQVAETRQPQMSPMDLYWASGLAHFLLTLKEVDVLDIDGSTVSKSSIELFSEDITNDHSKFWDYYYEMEMISRLVNFGLNANPIDEDANQGSSPDIRLDTGDQIIWIECKNKQRTTPHGWELERLGREIVDNLWTSTDLQSFIGKDSFAVSISADESISQKLINNTDVRTKFIKKVSGLLAIQLRDDIESVHLEFEDTDFILSIEDYYNGPRRVELTDDEMTALKGMTKIEKIIDPYQHLDVQVDTYNTDGHGVSHMEFIDENTIELLNCFLFSFDIPWFIQYDDWVFDTINRIPSQHSELDNLVAAVKIPPGMV